MNKINEYYTLPRVGSHTIVNDLFDGKIILNNHIVISVLNEISSEILLTILCLAVNLR